MADQEIIANTRLIVPSQVDQCLIGLPGRSQPWNSMMDFCEYVALPNTLLVVPATKELCWYPMPNGANAQQGAIAGLQIALKAVSKVINSLLKKWKLPKDKVTLLGWSAGAVVAIQLALRSQKSFASVVSLSGAILEPEKVMKNSGKTTTFFLKHNRDDDCFDWEERYLPMKRSLMSNGYKVELCERSTGNHAGMTYENAHLVTRHLSEIYGNSSETAEEELSEV